MPEGKLKSENYSNFGGLNTKVSQYITENNEFLALTNWDFSTPGSLTKRPGTTQYLGARLSGPITGIFEFANLNGSSQILVGSSAGLFKISGTTFNAISSRFSDVLSFDSLVDHCFIFDGATMARWSGSSIYDFSLPAPFYLPWVAGTEVGFTTQIVNGGSLIGSGLSGVYRVGVGYLNNRGFYGPIYSQTLTLNGITFKSFYTPSDFDISNANRFGITAIVTYRSFVDGTDLFITNHYPIASPVTLLDGGLTLGQAAVEYYDFYGANGTNGDPNIVSRHAAKFGEVFSNRLFLGGFSMIARRLVNDVVEPEASTVWFSETGEPEGFFPENNFEVRTNDSDRITGFKAFNRSLIIFKNNSFHELTGDNASNFVLSQQSDQYGCVSSQGAVVFNDTMYFIDKKGICEYNGSNVSIVSDKIESVFKTMNLSAASKAVALHNKLRNELWFAIPCDGSSTNNCIVIYDYVAKAWAVWEVNASALAIARGSFLRENGFLGDYDGRVSYFGSTIYGDNGSTITCTAQSRFVSELGQSVEKQYRRLYTNYTHSATTNPLTVSFRTNYQTTVNETRSIDMGASFQNIIDFGLPARSLSVEFKHQSATDTCVIGGYTIEYRMQRAK